MINGDGEYKLWRYPTMIPDGRIVHCSTKTWWEPVRINQSNEACLRSYVWQSETLCSHLTKLMLDISFELYHYRVEYTSSIKRFSLVRDPFEIMPNKDLLCVNRCRGAGLPRAYSLDDCIANASLTSAARTEHVTLRDLLGLMVMGTATPSSSISNTSRPRWDVMSWFPANDASLYPTIRIESNGNNGNLMTVASLSARCMVALITVMCPFAYALLYFWEI